MKTKKVAAVIMSMVMAVSISACGSGNNNASGSQEKKTSKGVVEVTIPTFLSGENVGALFFLPQVERFNAKYEGQYKINIEEVPQASYPEKIKQLAQQNKLPVLIHMVSDRQWFDQVILANDMAYDLSKFAEENPDVKAAWVPESIDFCTVDGKLICEPTSVLRPMGLFYNETMYNPEKDIKDQTMDEFIHSLGDNKIAFQTADNGWTTGLLLTAMIASKEGGAQLLSDSAEDKLWDYTDPAIVDAVEDLKGLMQTSASSNSVGAAYADAANSFMSKNASIICNGSWMAGDFEAVSEDKWSNGFDGEQVKATIYPENQAIVNPRSYGEFWVSNNASEDEIALAEAFLAFRDTREEIEEFILAQGGSAPQIEYSEEFLNKQKESRILYELSESISDETKYIVSIFDVMPASVADTEFGKLLPKLVDNTLSAEEFCVELTKKAEEAKQ